ncbi:hypothetical protein C8F01DRAFT_1160835 [Mycena amicta]|nr:hypothetical protein C8F01DRAFT_1160835 [Mycena amicta]
MRMRLVPALVHATSAYTPTAHSTAWENLSMSLVNTSILLRGRRQHGEWRLGLRSITRGLIRGTEAGAEESQVERFLGSR